MTAQPDQQPPAWSPRPVPAMVECAHTNEPDEQGKHYVVLIVRDVTGEHITFIEAGAFAEQIAGNLLAENEYAKTLAGKLHTPPAPPAGLILPPGLNGHGG